MGVGKTKIELNWVLVGLLLVPFVLASTDYDFTDEWDVSDVSEATNDYVFFKDIDDGAYIDGGHMCECHMFSDEEKVRLSINGELTDIMAVLDFDVMSDSLVVEITDIDLGTPDEVEFELDGVPAGPLDEGDTDTYTIDGKDYEVTASMIEESYFDMCVCSGSSERSNCVADANSTYGSSEPLVLLCGSGFWDACVSTMGTATLDTSVAKRLESPSGYQYKDCGTSFSRQAESLYYAPLNNNPAIIDQRRIQCGGTGQEDEITYKGRAGPHGKVTYGQTSDTCPANHWCDQTAADNNKLTDATTEFDIDPTDEISSDDICRKKNGESCSATIECLTGTMCSGGYCGGAGGNTTDLEIINLIPIQVIPGVDMVKDKSGFVRVVVRNNGAIGANGSVVVTFNGVELDASDGFGGANQVVAANKTVNYTFDFKPTVAGENLIIQANVTVN
ncbi:hypothetical protein ACFL1B_05910 [Nanoarchaeota archaeon]